MAARKKILIVEDEKDVLTYLKAIFEDNGYDTVIAEDGIEGLDLAKSEHPNLITLDIAMPNQSGVKTYRQFKTDPEIKEIPVIVITALGEDMRRYFKKVPGFTAPDGFMPKPIDTKKLVKMTADLLSDA